jgi:hypothetical protein
MARGWGGQVIAVGVLGDARASAREGTAQRVEPATEIKRGGPAMREAMVDTLGMGWLPDYPVAEEKMLWSRRRSS